MHRTEQAQLVYVDLKSQWDDFNIQENRWLLNGQLCSPDNRRRLIDAYRLGSEVDVSLLYWEGTEQRARVRVTAISPRLVLDVTADLGLPSVPRDPIDEV